MRCFHVSAVDSVESRIPVQSEGGETFIDLGEGKRVTVQSEACSEDEDGQFIENVSIEFAEDGCNFSVVASGSDDNEALLLLPPTGHYGYVSMGKEKLKLSASSKDVSLLVVLQKGNRILVTPLSEEDPLQQTILLFDGENIIFKTLNQPEEKEED